jgi:hypothetical protein
VQGSEFAGKASRHDAPGVQCRSLESQFVKLASPGEYPIYRVAFAFQYVRHIGKLLEKNANDIISVLFNQQKRDFDHVRYHSRAFCRYEAFDLLASVVQVEKAVAGSLVADVIAGKNDVMFEPRDHVDNVWRSFDASAGCAVPLEDPQSALK